ncbi:MAG: hypothetical protein QOG89_2026 [Thermomicrobiales bacterium]|nr:hypothetical protein [Thermomicrobiales bacterium]
MDQDEGIPDHGEAEQASYARFGGETDGRDEQPACRQDAPRPRRPTRILFAGHDFKFLRFLLSHFREQPDYCVLTDDYESHALGNKAKSAELLKQADVIFCEWCLGNAEWYSHHALKHQKLIVRLHAQEVRLGFLDRINWQRVDRIVIVSEHYFDMFTERVPSMAGRALLLRNAVDCESFDKPKRDGSEFNLGLLGICPRQKSPHLAIEIVRRLRVVDERYRLFIKGKHPSEYEWLWARPEERAYYERFYDDVNRSDLADSVVFDEFGDDVAEWFTEIGTILSTSEHESAHLAVAEGMASGAVPVIRGWAGARRHYPERYVVQHEAEAFVTEAVATILERDNPIGRLQESRFCKAFVRDNFDRRCIIRQYEELLSELWEPV